MLCLRGFFTQKKWDSQPPILLSKNPLKYGRNGLGSPCEKEGPTFWGCWKKKSDFLRDVLVLAPSPGDFSHASKWFGHPKIMGNLKWTKYRSLGAYLFPETSWLCVLGLKNNYLISGSSFGEAVAFPDPIIPVFARKIDIIYLSLCLRLAI